MSGMFELVQLRSFALVAQSLSFTRAAERLGVRQSTVSQHVRKLETAVGRQLLVRDTHTVALTPDGLAMLDFAGTILDTAERARAHFDESRVRGRVSFGMSEDLVLTRLPRILAEFRRRHPLVDLELTVGHSPMLRELAQRGELDLVFGKRNPWDTYGTPVWRDRWVWVAGPELPRLGPRDHRRTQQPSRLDNPCDHTATTPTPADEQEQRRHAARSEHNVRHRVYARCPDATAMRPHSPN